VEIAEKDFGHAAAAQLLAKKKLLHQCIGGSTTAVSKLLLTSGWHGQAWLVGWWNGRIWLIGIDGRIDVVFFRGREREVANRESTRERLEGR
jgi:hypothetical protein